MTTTSPAPALDDPIAALRDHPITRTYTMRMAGASDALKALDAVGEKPNRDGIVMVLGDLMHLARTLGLDFEELRDDAERDVTWDESVDAKAGLHTPSASPQPHTTTTARATTSEGEGL